MYYVSDIPDSGNLANVAWLLLTVIYCGIRSSRSIELHANAFQEDDVEYASKI